MTSFSAKTVHKPKKMVITRGTKSLTLGEQPSKPYEPANNEGKGNALHKESDGKELQVQNHKEVKQNGKERVEKDWHNKVKIFDAYVAFKDEFI